MSRENLLGCIEQLEAVKTQLSEQIQFVDQDLEILHRAIEVLDRTMQMDAGHMKDLQDFDGRQLVPAGEPSLIAGCRSMIKACEILADANGGLLRLTPAAREIRRVGLSRARTTASVSATLHGYLKKRSDDWEQVGPGTWRRRVTPNGPANDRGENRSAVVGSSEQEIGGAMTVT